MEVISACKLAEAAGGEIINGDGSCLIHAFSTNSKQGDSGTVFVPIIGERADGHDYIKDAYEHGMRVTFTSRNRKELLAEDMIYIVVSDTVLALQRVGKWYRSNFFGPVIGITGSVGKTTTKEMIAAALQTSYHILKTDGNKNGQIGLPQMMCELTSTVEIAVIEMGMSEQREMERISDISQPVHAVITNIGVSHIAQLGSKENIRKEKLNIVNYFTSDSKLFVNGDDPLLAELYYEFNNQKTDKEKTQMESKIAMNHLTRKKLENASVLTFGTNENCDYRAADIRIENGETRFCFLAKNKSGQQIKEEITLSVMGLHNVLNALAALALALEYDIPIETAGNGLKAYQPLCMRGSIEQAGTITIMDDTYNASPDSVIGAVDVFLNISCTGKRVVVLADILELGEVSAKCHYELGEFLASQPIDLVITYGEESQELAKGIRENNHNKEVISFIKRDEAKEYLLKVVNNGDCVLLKGSRGMRVDLLVQALKEISIK